MWGLKIGTLTCAAVLFACFGTPAAAQSEADSDVETPEIVAELFECREISDGQERLACFDREVNRVYEAQESRDLVIADREQIQEAKRGVFGLRIPSLKIFGGDDDDEGVTKITATLVSAKRGDNGRYIFELDDGARWLQTESVIGRQRYKAGDTIIIEKAAFSGFKAKINGKFGVRVRRIN